MKLKKKTYQQKKNLNLCFGIIYGRLFLCIIILLCSTMIVKYTEKLNRFKTFFFVLFCFVFKKKKKFYLLGRFEGEPNKVLYSESGGVVVLASHKCAIHNHMHLVYVATVIVAAVIFNKVLDNQRKL